MSRSGPTAGRAGRRRTANSTSHVTCESFFREGGPASSASDPEKVSCCESVQRKKPDANARWQNLRDNLARWVNIFRIDDFVGTHVDGYEVGEQPFIQEYPLDAGGHTNYWSQREVNAILNHYL